MSRERKVYRYILGGQSFALDPIQFIRHLQMATGGRLSALINDANRLVDQESLPHVKEGEDGFLQALAARDQLNAATIRALGLPAFDPMTGEGVLDEDVTAFLIDFLRWQHEKK